MAKVRRIVRTVQPGGQASFDDHLWPVQAALVVLGAFLAGVVLSFTRTDNAWYANTWLWLPAVILLTAAAMVALCYIENRLVRRAVQLSAVLCLIFHLMLGVALHYKKILARFWPEPVRAVRIEQPRERLIFPDYHQFDTDGDNRPRRDFEQPLEAETPEPTPEQLDHRQTEAEHQPQQPQHVPTSEPETTASPNLTARTELAQTVPRQSDSPSRLSRRTAPSPSPANRQLVADAASRAAPSSSSSQLVAQASQLNRQQTEAPTPERNVVETPAPARRVAAATPNRRDSPQASPEITASNAPRRRASGSVTAPTETSAAAPSTTDLAARNDAAVRSAPVAPRRVSSSPQAERSRQQPEADAQATVSSRIERRDHPNPAQPTVAATPAPVTNQRPRMTTQPQIASTTVDSQRTAPSNQAQREAPAARSVGVARSASETTPSPQSVAQNAPTGQQAQTPRPVNMARQNAPAAPSAEPTPTAAPAPSRQSPNAIAAAPTNVESPAPMAAARTAESGEVSPTSTAIQRSSQASPSAAPSSAEPQVASTAQAASPARASLARRQAGRSQAGEAGDSNNAVRRSTSQANAPPTTSVADAESNRGPVTAPQSETRAAASEVARQPARSLSTTRNQQVAEAPSTSPRTQVARTSATRSPTSSVPVIDPQANLTSRPRRTPRSATSPASPTVASNPAIAQSTSGAARPSAQPARTALNRSTAGIAGVGEAANLDQARPAPEQSARAASNSARRARAVQQEPEGAALNPVSSALVRRTRATADTPQSNVQAADVPFARNAGSRNPADLQASTSAALARSNAAAEPSDYTAAVGTVDVDRGPTFVVSENGAGRASGGGQPEINVESEAPRAVRRDAGGAPQIALAVDDAAPAPVAPRGDSGGRPPTIDPVPNAVATVRTEIGGAEPVTGGPARADEAGEPTESSIAPRFNEVQLSRAESAAGAARGEDEPSMQQAAATDRNIARQAAGGSPQLALTGPVVGEQSASPAAPQADQGGAPVIQVARSGDDGAPAEAQRAAQAAVGGAPAAGEQVASIAIARAEAVDAPLGAAAVGGGSASPARAAAAPAINALAQAETITASGAAGDGAATPRQLAAASVGMTSRAGEAGQAAASRAETDTGAAGGAAPQAGDSGPSRASGAQSGPEVGELASAGAVVRRNMGAAAAAGPPAMVEAESPGDIPQSTAAGAMGDLAGLVDMGPMSRDSGGAGPVDVDAPDGPGGVAETNGTAAGVNRRLASRQSVQLQVSEARFVRSDVGGLPDFNTAAMAAAEPFRRRGARARGENEGSGEGIPGPRTEETIDRGLVFLARYQSPDGSWSLQRFNERVALASDTAATALALLAFQGAGYNHREHKYAGVVFGGVDYLVKNQQDNGDLFVPLDDESNRSVWLYSHSIATLALCEAYGMTQDPALREPAQSAIDFLVDAQHESRGGWRYSPGVGADTSVTGWAMMALKSGQLANLNVPREAFDKIGVWLDDAQESENQAHLFRYNPLAPDTPSQRHGRAASRTMTSVGLLMRLYGDWGRDNPNMIAGADYLRENLPALGSRRDNQRDTYYWYYGTQVMFHMGGDYWRDWNSRLHPLLVDTQVQNSDMAGSWDPRSPLPDRWAPHAGRLYVTTMNLLSLEVYYRHLPLYDDTAR